MKNRLCEVLGVRYPIIQGGMAWSTDATLAAAVSNWRRCRNYRHRRPPDRMGGRRNKKSKDPDGQALWYQSDADGA